jgi:hypothetical protein
MSQLNVDTIKNRLGTAGPTVLSLTVTNDAVVGGALTVTGDLTVNGTETIINTTSLEVEDKNIGIASVSSPTDLTADGGGITIYGIQIRPGLGKEILDALSITNQVSLEVL